MFKPSSPEVRIAAMLRALQQRPANGQGGDMRSLATLPGTWMPDWMFAPEAERARMASGSLIEQILPAKIAAALPRR